MTDFRTKKDGRKYPLSNQGKTYRKDYSENKPISKHSRFAELQASSSDTDEIRERKLKSYFEKMEDNDIKVTYDGLITMYPKSYIDKQIDKGNIQQKGANFTYKK